MGKNRKNRSRSRSPNNKNQHSSSNDAHLAISMQAPSPTGHTTTGPRTQSPPQGNAQRSNTTEWRAPANPNIPGFSRYSNQPLNREITAETVMITYLRGYSNDIPKNVLYSGHTLSKIKSPFRRKVYLLMEDPRSSWPAWFITMWVTFTIVFGTVVFVMSSYSDFRDYNFWFPISAVLVASYFLEYCLRLYVHGETFHSASRFILSPLGFFDLISWLPFVLELAITQSNDFGAQRFGVLRIFRLFQLFRVYKDVNLLQLSIEILIAAVRKSADAMTALILFLFACSIALGTLLYFAERSTVQPEKSEQLDNIATTIWFMVVCMASVGFGDVMPISPWGRLVTFFAIGLGILLIALPSVVVGRNYIAIMMSLRKHRPRGALEKIFSTGNDASATTINPKDTNETSALPTDPNVRLEMQAGVHELRLMAHELASALDRVQFVLSQIPSDYGAHSQFSVNPHQYRGESYRMIEPHPYDRDAMNRAMESYDDAAKEW